MFIRQNDKTALIWNNSEISYSELLTEIGRISALAKPVTAERIAVFSENRPEWIYTLYASWLNRSAVVTVDFLSGADDVAYILNDCSPEIVFCSDQTWEVLKSALNQYEQTPLIINLDRLPDTSSDSEPINFSPGDVQDTALIIYTSGTTGSPKGVMLSFDNLLANLEAVCVDLPIFNMDRSVMALLPFHHIFALLGTIVAPLFAGGTIVFTPSLVSEDIINTLQKYQINIIIGVPRLYAAIRKGVMDKVNASSAGRMLFGLAGKIGSRAFSKILFKKVHEKFGGRVDYLVSGGAKLDDAVATDFKILGFEVLEGY